MISRWLPWKYLVKRAARAYGVLDPITLLARLRRFAQPGEVQEPIELLRAGMVFHARGLVNTRAIQHNLDWVWPYWVERQFNPQDPSFIPRAFSFTHVNLTHRNWTAVGRPDLDLYPLVDPRGMVTPHYDGWSLDFWIVSGDTRLLPSRLDGVEQKLVLDPTLEVVTRACDGGLEMESRVRVDGPADRPELAVGLTARGPEAGWLVVAVRPTNPEGVQFVERIALDAATSVLTVNGQDRMILGAAPHKVLFSTYARGDVLRHLDEDPGGPEVECRVGMATAAALFPLAPGQSAALDLRVPLARRDGKVRHPRPARAEDWAAALDGAARLRVPDVRLSFLYDAAVRTLLLLSAGDLVPGPYTYRRFWFRDACLMLHALLGLGLTDRSALILDGFPARQRHSGYFRSQEGEWDSNGQVLWILGRFRRLTGRPLPEAWLPPIRKGADWIEAKRTDRGRDVPHAGLLPPGFSAEHFGPNDYYYWDDFWAVAGLREAAGLARETGDADWARRLHGYAADLEAAVWRSVRGIPPKRAQGAIPASPYRRLDAGAIGSMVADYPLRLTPADDPRVGTTLEFLLSECLVSGAFFQDMIHSGLNIYLTLALAQTLLRRGDARHRALIHRVADLASPTGQWPEAIHPGTGGGCMGDGQHGWAAAEWVMMMRNLFVREEDDRLVLGAGLFPEWIGRGEPLSFGPTPTPWGPVSVEVVEAAGKVRLRVESSWFGPPPRLEVRVPGFRPVADDGTRAEFPLEPA